ncbi:hypothetical protein D3C75_954940 [compost metagenome]
MVRGVISADQKTAAHGRLLLGGLTVGLPAGLLVSPMQQRQIHQAIDDNAPAVLGIILGSPRLENSRNVAPSFQQNIRSLQGSGPGAFVPFQNPVGFDGERIEKSDVMMLQARPVLQTLPEVVQG